MSLLGRANGTPVKSVVINDTVSAADLVEGVSGKRIKVLGWVATGTVSLGNTATIRFTDAVTDYTGDMNLTFGKSVAPLRAEGYFTVAAGLGLDYIVSSDGTAGIDGILVYVLVD